MSKNLDNTYTSLNTAIIAVNQSSLDNSDSDESMSSCRIKISINNLN